MPTRYLKESICTSDDINALTPFEETVFYRLIVTVDDFGRFDGRISVLKSRLFPLKEDMRATQVEKAIESLSSAGMVKIYYVDKKPFLQMTGWDRHQTARATKSKYPGPELSDTPDKENTVSGACIQPYTDADDGIQIPADSPVIVIDNRNSVFDNRKSKSDARTREESDDDVGHGDVVRLNADIANIETAMRNIGFPFAAQDLDTANLLLADFPSDWILEAIRRAADAGPTARSWRYIKGILRNWQQKGGIDDVNQGRNAACTGGAGKPAKPDNSAFRAGAIEL